MKQSIDFGFDDHPEDDEDRPRSAWAVSVRDDCDGCGDVRVELTLEEEGPARGGVVAHLSPETARRLRVALSTALKELGENPG